MNAAVLDSIRNLIQEDVNQRGLGTDPTHNLLNAFPDDFRLACVSLAEHPGATLAIVTGFFIPTGQPPCGETDGPLGAVFFARALHPLGIRVVIATDDFCVKAINAGLNLAGLRKEVPLVVLPTAKEAGTMTVSEYHEYFRERTGLYTHLLALERAGPSQTQDSLRRQNAAEATVRTFLDSVPPNHQDRCHTLRGRDITNTMSPAQRLFEDIDPSVVTLGIGDGGNEIGMGKIPWEVIRRNVPDGGMVACRVPTQHLIVCGISNWGAYGLAAGVLHARGAEAAADLFNTEREFQILETMVEMGPLVDGVSGLATATVDGLPFEKYGTILTKLKEI